LGDEVTVGRKHSAPAVAHLEPEDIPLKIVYEDEDLVVIEKPAGMVVHPSAGHSSGTLVHALLARYPELRSGDARPGDEERPGIVHRLDKDTSGLMLVARTQHSLRYLQAAMHDRQVLKEYTLLCCGPLDPASARIEASIGRHPGNRLKMAVVSTGRPSVSEYETMQTLPQHTLTLARLHTGRTHQIRVHFASIGRPIAGDRLYGGCALPGLERQFLHASRLGLTLPGGKHVEWQSPLPEDLEKCLLAAGAQVPTTAHG
jgi:23S rRNA pseudouridine1911/1915/1917 synthase